MVEAGGDLRDYFDLRGIREFDVAEAVALVEREMLEGRPNERLLFSLVMLAEWHHSFVRRMSVDSRV